MAATTKIWVNSSAPTCEDDDLNGFKSENNNLIVGSGQSLSTTDNQQTHKAVAHYAGVGDFYADSGAANAYVLSVTGVQVAPPAYANGLRIRFVAGNANTGPSTVNVAGLGVKSIVRDSTGTALLAGHILTGQQTYAYYDGTVFRAVLALDIVLRQKVIEIGDWDMTTAVNKTVTHGLTVTKMRKISVTIRDDSGNIYSFDNSVSSTAATWAWVSNTATAFVSLTADAAGPFNAAAFSTTPYNRGWVTIDYEG